MNISVSKATVLKLKELFKMELPEYMDVKSLCDLFNGEIHVQQIYNLMNDGWISCYMYDHSPIKHVKPTEIMKYVMDVNYGQ